MLRRRILCFVCCLTVGCSRTPTGDAWVSSPRDLSAEARSRFQKVAEDLQVQIVLANHDFPVHVLGGEVTGEETDTAALEGYSEPFAYEFSFYSRELIRKSQLRKIVVCKNLTDFGAACGGLADHEHHTLFLCLNHAWDNRRALRRTIHHEVFHLLDYVDDGSIAVDAQWLLFNLPISKSGGTLDIFDFNNSAKEKPPVTEPNSQFVYVSAPGFITPYAKTSMAEDKAELFASLMIEPSMVRLRGGVDRIVKAKADLLQARLRTDFGLYDAFWERAAAAEAGRADD